MTIFSYGPSLPYTTSKWIVSGSKWISSGSVGHSLYWKWIISGSKWISSGSELVSSGESELAQGQSELAHSQTELTKLAGNVAELEGVPVNLASNVAEMRDNQAELLGRLERLEETSSIDSASQKRNPDHSSRVVAEQCLTAALPLAPKVTRETMELLRSPSQCKSTSVQKKWTIIDEMAMSDWPTARLPNLSATDPMLLKIWAKAEEDLDREDEGLTLLSCRFLDLLRNLLNSRNVTWTYLSNQADKHLALVLQWKLSF